MIKVGLTGNIACGKTLVENMLKNQAIPVVDADEIVHQLYEEEIIVNQIKELFNNQDITENGKLSRKKIAGIVFDDREKLKELEKILHLKVKALIKEFFEENCEKPLAVASVVLLFESEFEELFDKIIFIKIEPQIQLQRLIKRNNISKKDALKRINVQAPQEEKIQKADFVIDNSSTPDNTEAQLKKILAELFKNKL